MCHADNSLIKKDICLDSVRPELHLYIFPTVDNRVRIWAEMPAMLLIRTYSNLFSYYMYLLNYRIGMADRLLRLIESLFTDLYFLLSIPVRSVLSINLTPMHLRRATIVSVAIK